MENLLEKILDYEGTLSFSIIEFSKKHNNENTTLNFEKKTPGIDKKFLRLFF